MHSATDEFTASQKISTDSTRASQYEPQIIVADWANHRAVRMDDMRGGNWTVLGDQYGNGIAVDFPTSLASDSAGRLFVAQQRRPRIVCLADDPREPVRSLDLPNSNGGHANRFVGSWIFVDDADRIYLSYDGHHRIVRVDNMNGDNWIAFGSAGTGQGQFSYPAGIWVDQQHRIFIADFNNFRIVRIDDMLGRNWKSLGSYGSGAKQFINPCGIWGDSLGRIYVADQGNDRIVRFDDMDGKNWTTIGFFGTGKSTGMLYSPTGICIDRIGRIYVTECSINHRIIRMDDMLGTNWIVLGKGGSGKNQFASPMGIFVR